MGILGRVPNTREWVVPGTPYVLAYRVAETMLTVRCDGRCRFDGTPSGRETGERRGESFHITPLARGVDGVEGERGLPRAADPGYHDHLPERQLQIQALQIVLAGTADEDGLAAQAEVSRTVEPSPRADTIGARLDSLPTSVRETAAG
jgi:hypothetical protein